MNTLFPVALDLITNPQPNTPTNQALTQHAAQHTTANSAIMAIQAKLGVDGSQNPDTIEARLRGKVTLVNAPSTLTSPGTFGSIAITNTHLFVCTDTNTWIQIALGDPAPRTQIYKIGDVLATCDVLSEPAWLLCGGQTRLQADYPELFQKLGLIAPEPGDVYNIATEFITPTLITPGLNHYIRAT